MKLGFPDHFFTEGLRCGPRQLAAVDCLLSRCADLMKQADKPKSSKPRVFVGSSVEGLEIARVIQSELQYDYFVEIWNQNTIFGLGTTTIEALDRRVK